jgi:PAS domain S-box-containing protein
MTVEPSTAKLKARIKELEEALKRSACEWENTVNALSDWVCIIDLDFRIVRTNRAVEDFLGIPPEEVLGRTCYEIVHGTGTHIDHCPIPPMVKALKRSQTEVQIGDGRWLSVTADPLTDKVGILTGAVHMVRDITRLREVQAEHEVLIQELQQTLSEVKTLKGLIPICANCRRIRDDSGSWSPLEAFVRNNFDADFSHGLCPECAAREYAEYDLK